MGVSHNPSIVTDGLVFCLDISDKNSYAGSGTQVNDLAGTDQNNTLSNSDIGTLSAGLFDFAGNTSNGLTRYVALPATIGYTTEVSFFTWFKRENNSGVAGGYHIICGPTAFEMSVHASDSSLFLRNGITIGGTRYVANNGNTLGTGTWHNVGVTYSNYTKRAYIDGVEVGSQTCGSSGNIDHSVSARRLGRFGTSSYSTHGKLGPFHVYNRVLSNTEIAHNFSVTRVKFGV